MGANLVGDGATFRVWAPRATHVYVALGGADELSAAARGRARQGPGHRPLDRASSRAWSTARSTASSSSARAARGSSATRGRASSSCTTTPTATASCATRTRTRGTTQASGRRRSTTWSSTSSTSAGSSRATTPGRDRRPGRVAKFLDALDRVEYLADLGVNAVQPLPVVEFAGEWSLGYNGTDLFSPEMDYCVDPADLPPYLERVNALLARKGSAPLTLEQLERSGQPAQGVRRRLPPLRDRRPRRRRLQPRRRRLRRPEHRPLRLPRGPGRRATASTSPARTGRAGACSRSTGPTCARS